MVNLEKSELNKLWEGLKEGSGEIILEYNDAYDTLPIDDLLVKVSEEDVVALFELGSRYRLGVDGVELDEEKAFLLYYKVLGKQRNALAVKHIGTMLGDGICSGSERKESVRWLELASLWGESDATMELAYLYEEGKNVEKNKEKALELYFLSLNQGNAHANFDIGHVYRERGDYEKEKYYYEKALEDADEYFSCIFLGLLYEYGDGVEKDYAKAMELYRMAYEHEIVGDAAYRMGVLYFQGKGVEKNYVRAYELFSEALENDMEEANLYMGVLTYGVKKDAEKALLYLDQAPSHMQDIAKFQMGRIYEEEGKTQEAIKEYEIAVSLGNADAEERLSRLQKTYEESNVLNKLKVLPIEELLEYYSEGEKRAAYPIARAYSEGSNGASVDYKKAIHYYFDIINNQYPGVDHARFDLSMMYLEGKGTERRPKEAERLLLEAAENKFSLAYVLLGNIYRQGLVDEKDVDKAVFWLKKGSETGNTLAKIILAEMYFCSEIDGRQDMFSGIELIRQVLEINPNDEAANMYMAQFQLIGVIENNEIIVEKECHKAIQLLEKLEQQGVRRATSLLLDIYSGDYGEEFSNYHMALVYAEKAVSDGNNQEAFRLASLHLAKDFHHEAENNPKRGIEAGKIFLLYGKETGGLKEFLMIGMLQYLELCGVESEYVRDECNFLLENMHNMGLVYSDEKKMRMLENNICKVLFIVMSELIQMGRQGIPMAMKTLERFEQQVGCNEYLKETSKKGLAHCYNELGRICLKNVDLQGAKTSFEHATNNGSMEAAKELRHFKNNIFGKLVYKKM